MSKENICCYHNDIKMFADKIKKIKLSDYSSIDEAMIDIQKYAGWTYKKREHSRQYEPIVDEDSVS